MGLSRKKRPTANMNVLTALTLAVIAACLAPNPALAAGKTCASDSECASGECCQIMSEYMVVSRREAKQQAILQPLTRAPRTGTCESYKAQGASCNSFEKINGFCGCDPSLTCKTYQDPNFVLPTMALMTPAPQQVASRRMVMPGYLSSCEKPDA